MVTLFLNIKPPIYNNEFISKKPTKSDYVFILNNDVTLDKNILKELLKVAESDVSETASDSTNVQEISVQPTETTPTAEEVSGQSAETIPTAEEILGYPAKTTSADQENEVQSVDTEQKTKEMKESRIISDDDW